MKGFCARPARRAFRGIVVPIISVAVLCVCMALRLFSQAPSVEAEVKAAFLFNFAQFIEWPAQAFPLHETPFSLCVLGSPLDKVLEKTVEGQSVNGRAIVV